MQTEKSRIRRAERRAYLKILDAARANVPAHLIGRIGQPSQLGKNLEEIGEYGWKGIAFDEDGEPLRRSDVNEIKKLNADQHAKAVKKAKELKAKYPKYWNARGGAAAIASKEKEKKKEIHANTVRRYIKMKLDME